MLNEQGVRELVYVVAIDAIEPIVGSDNCEAAVVGGWRVMVRKNTFNVGDLAVYFEIDAKVPETETFAFLEKKHYKVKTQRYTFGGKNPGFYSQGLLMSAEELGGKVLTHEDGGIQLEIRGLAFSKGAFLTEILGVVYAEADDNKRKAKSADRYKLMVQRRPDIFKKKWAQWFMRRNWGKKLMFFFFGKKKDKKNGWPSWVVKTDEERVQNMPWILADKTEWYATEKIDGTSTTFTMKGWGRKREFYVCSRNVVFDKPDKKCFYETNVYTEMAEKYHMEDILGQLMLLDTMYDAKPIEFVTLQSETYGAGIQKRDYGLTGHDLMVFNVIFGYADGTTRRLNPREMTDLLVNYDVPCVPIVDEQFVMPDTVDELLAIATDASKVDGGMREGLVFRSVDGKKSFKAVSNEFLMKYHG